MKVDVFLSSTFNNREREILVNMCNGIKRDIWSDGLSPASKKMMAQINKDNGLKSGVELNQNDKGNGKYDLAVIMGSWKPERSNVHHAVRTKVAEDGRPFLCIETQLLGRKIFQPNAYHRVGLNGFVCGQGIFGVDKEYPDDRFKQLELPYNGWKENRQDKIILALQLPGDASLRGMDMNNWAIHSLQRLREVTDRPIEIRTHPGGMSAKGVSSYAPLFEHLAFANYKKVTCVNGKEVPWEDQILKAHCVVSYSSGLSIDAVLNGIPVIAHDSGNFAFPICDNKLDAVENLSLPSEDIVQQWLNTLAYCQWTPHEMESGYCWEHLKPCVLEEIERQRNESSELS